VRTFYEQEEGVNFLRTYFMDSLLFKIVIFFMLYLQNANTAPTLIWPNLNLKNFVVGVIIAFVRQKFIFKIVECT